MARAANQIQRFRTATTRFLDALNELNAAAKTIDYLGGLALYGAELDKTDATGAMVSDITKAQLTGAIGALVSVNGLLEADNQTIGRRLTNMRE